MTRPICKHQVVNSIIGMISVYMVYYVTTLKFSTHKFFKYISIISTLPSRMKLSLHFLKLTLRRTKNKFPLFMTFIVGKTLKTIITHKQSLSGLVIALSTAKSSFLTWRSIKHDLTLFTNVFHINNYSTQCVEAII